MRKQQGVTLSGLLIWAVALVFLALLGFKVAPAYFEYLTIQKEFKEMASDPALSRRRKERQSNGLSITARRSTTSPPSLPRTSKSARTATAS